jgi:hypothetical protein
VPLALVEANGLNLGLPTLATIGALLPPASDAAKLAVLPSFMADHLPVLNLTALWREEVPVALASRVDSRFEPRFECGLQASPLVAGEPAADMELVPYALVGRVHRVRALLLEAVHLRQRVLGTWPEGPQCMEASFLAQALLSRRLTAVVGKLAILLPWHLPDAARAAECPDCDAARASWPSFRRDHPQPPRAH